MTKVLQQLPLLLLLLLNAATTARGQGAGPPPGGFPLREVTVLHRVAEPAGGLIPYRQGKLWGYADSTGRVWIQPSLPDEPTFFVRGLASLSITKPINERMSRILGNVLLNARGECLRLSPQQVALLRPDSVLERRERADVVGQRIVEAVYFSWAGSHWAIGKAYPTWPGASGRGPGLYVKRTVGRRYGFPIELYELHNAKGRKISKQLYSSVYKFQGPWGRFESDNYNIQRPGAEKGMLDRHGREIGGRFYHVSGEYTAAYASVAQRPDGGFGLIDTTGRFVLGPSDTYSYSVPDSAGLVLRATLERIPATRDREAYARPVSYDFVRLDGQPAFPDLPSFGKTTGFGTDDRQPYGPDLALVYTSTGAGVLEKSGRWRVPPRYENLTLLTDFNKLPQTSFSLMSFPGLHADQNKDMTHQRPPDLGVLLAQREGKIGMVRLRDGREIIPARYTPWDSNDRTRYVWPLYQGFAGFARDGQNYLVNARGEEVAKGLYRGWDFRVRGQRYLFLELDKPATEGGRFWALVDTAGRPLLPPLTRPSLLRGVSSAGLVLVQYLDEAAGPRGTEVALDPQGRPVLTGLNSLVVWQSLIMGNDGSRADGTLLFDAQGQPLPPARLFQPVLLPRAQVLLGHLRPPGSATDSLVVLDGRGRRWATLPVTWQPVEWSNYPPAQAQGRVVPVVQTADKRKLGYLTRGGQKLWQD